MRRYALVILTVLLCLVVLRPHRHATHYHLHCGASR